MTPTEQDKELRDDIASILLYSELDIVNDVDAIMYLITTDRKRMELEARIDEATRGLSLSGKYEHRQYFTGRIAELKAQQEEV